MSFSIHSLLNVLVENTFGLIYFPFFLCINRISMFWMGISDLTWSLNLLEESSSMTTGEGIFLFFLKLGILGMAARMPIPMPYPPKSNPNSRESMNDLIESNVSSFLLEISWKIMYILKNIRKNILFPTSSKRGPWFSDVGFAIMFQKVQIPPLAIW